MKAQERTAGTGPHLCRFCKRGLLGAAAGVLLASIASFACGPFFPNTLLDQGDSALFTVPEARFQAEIERMKLVASVHKAQRSEDPSRDSVEVDLRDLAAALERSKVPSETRGDIIEAHRRERQKIDVLADASSSLRPNLTNGSRISGPLPRIVPGLPAEFADYFRGATAWHLGQMAEARSAWTSLLDRPPAERYFKSTWAAFMLGKSWEEENSARAISWFQRVRVLAKAGFADSLGLAASSQGWEARLHLREERFVSAIDLYLEQASAGDPSAIISLRWCASRALGRGSATLRTLAAHPRAQRVITAYIISGGWAKPSRDIDNGVKEATLQFLENASARSSFIPAPKRAWHTFQQPVLLWLDAVELAKVKNVDSAEQLALAAYQAGEMQTAQRWLDRAQSTPVTQWVQAKLHLRDGKVDAAAALLSQLCRSFPLASSRTNARSTSSLAESLYVDNGLSSTALVAQQVHGEMGVIYLSRRQYTEALDALLQSGYWMDAAYVAERVLTLDELKTYVDRHWPKETPPRARPPEEMAEDQPTVVERRLGQDNTSDQIRYLLARRLTRADRRTEARGYFPPEWQPSFDSFSAAVDDSQRRDLGKAERAKAYFAAAKIIRQSGLELVGTEVEPDWRIHGGDFEEGVTLSARITSRSTSALAASLDELQRASRNAPMPEFRWHYRYTAAALAMEGAKLMRDAEIPELARTARAEELFETAQSLHRFDRYAAQLEAQAGVKQPALLDRYPSAILAWRAAELMPDNSDETAYLLCVAGSWLKDFDPEAADLFYKALVRRCRQTDLGREADRLRWFPRLPH